MVHVLMMSMLLFGDPVSGSLQTKEKAVTGTFEIKTVGDRQVVAFGGNFKTKNGPDLKVVLSPLPFSRVSGKTAMTGALVLGKLKATKGSQQYMVPAGVDLSKYQSVLIHCEKYSVLWGGAPIR
ncbi:DM13 domain-containing protein [Acanthopleuribacter pedis]|uniref:DM13 domain-containing protein n=1 Tax=Acanthopleuribacter pedis TaxID=442870 RepID=A0A8J7U629_9BACT|nr:DM13 domain-containing protein [Acanthopleuribacter pedis]MBO1322337.1 DM13 domain-containing protein [Acanthopleuribacter pedis]